MRRLNLGILAHVDAGKTSLTERLLHVAGVIDEIGRVDDGTTQTDSLPLEQRRGITIKSAVVSFVVDGLTINLIDTPGHSDFIAEVERVLGVLDGAVLVVSAVEGVQAQTRVLMRALQRLRIPTLIFLNKIDRAGADPDRVLRDIADRLTPAVVAMSHADGLGTRAASSAPRDADEPAFLAALVDLIADHDEEFLDAYLSRPGTGSYPELMTRLAAQTARAVVHPVYIGSAVTGAGVPDLIDGVTRLLPGVSGDADATLDGTVFKVERGAAGERIAYLRLFAGAVHVRDRLALPGGATADKVTALAVFADGSTHTRNVVVAGEIAKVWGLSRVRIGDVVGEGSTSRDRHQFAPPSLETVVDPVRPADKGPLHAALAELAEQDPLIDLRQDDERQEVSVSLYGEVQKEVIEATLREDYGVEAQFRPTTTICIERLTGVGAAVEIIDEPPNEFLATVGLRVEPAPIGSGIAFGLAVELGSMPPAFFAAVESAVRRTLREGLHGWEVPDCVVTMTHSGYWARQSAMGAGFDPSMSSTAGDFRNLTPLVLMAAMVDAGTTVYEPMHRFELDVPEDALGTVLAALSHLRAVPRDTAPLYPGPQSTGVAASGLRLAGDIPAGEVRTLQEELAALTRGEGELLTEFDRYSAVRGPAPERPRTDLNPLDRRSYLMRLSGRGAVR